MRRPICCLTVILTLALLLVSCGEETPPPSADTVLSAMQASMTETAQTLPDGLTYTRATPEGYPTYLSDTLFSALYGEAARGLLTADETAGGTADEASDGGSVPPVNDAAIFLSVAPYPCELAVFRCSDTRTAATVAGICRARLDTVSRGYKGGEWEAVAQGGRVVVEGCFVLLAVAEDPEAVLEAARRVIG